MSNEVGTPLIVALADPSATLEQVGGKGASLARMATAGLPVPPGFHISTAAYRRFVAENELQAPILAAVSTASPEQPETLEEAATRIGDLFARSEMPAEIAEAIRQAYAQLGAQDLPVAVRSSATAEDLPEMSFAGQQETFLNMRGVQMVVPAVKRCWASLWTARAIGYRARHTIAPDEVSLAVVVQQLVPAEAAGILFTAHPLTGQRGQVMINAAWGLGEAIVSGQVTPDTMVVEKASGVVSEQQISEKDMMTVRTANGTHEEPVPADLRLKAVLSAEEATQLMRIGVQIEDLYGQPMDIEWAFYHDQFFIVQARPITALPDGSQATRIPQKEEWKLPNPKGRYFRSSVLELLPDPLTPLFSTLGFPAFGKATLALFKELANADLLSGNILAIINGYGYYDLSMTGAQTTRFALTLPRLFGMFPRLLSSSQPRWEAARARYSELVRLWQARDLVTISAADLLNGVNDITNEAADYYITVQSGILPAAYLSEAFFTLAYDKLLKWRNAPSALTYVLGFDSEPIQAEKSLYDLAQWTREQPDLVGILAKMSGEQFMAAYHQQAAPSEEATDKVWPVFWQRMMDHLARFGHTIYDLDFAKAVLADDPLPVLETLKFFLSGQAPDPYKRQESAEKAREQAIQGVFSRRKGLRLKLFCNLVRRAQRYAPLRENALADVGLGWPVLRRMLYEIGRRLVAGHAIAIPNDVFWLEVEELRKAVVALDTGQVLVDQHIIVAKRRAIWERERALTPPAVLPFKGGARFLGIDFSSMMPARLHQPEGDIMKGIAASPGKIDGQARVIHGPDEFAQMRPGDILVARITTPAWTPLFALASGIVTDVGGPLSHSSIVAREYHIPAVLGTGSATERLSSGQRITVDGDAGTVTIVH